jgi:hypothetical protein
MLKALAGAPVVLALTSVGLADAQNSAVCETPDDDGLPQSLGFVALAPDPEHACRTCTFWTADSTGQCGACEMMHRTTPAMAVCESWASH